jgi:hypothetical protein
MEGYLPDAEPFKHIQQFCKERNYDLNEVYEMISELKGEWFNDDGEILQLENKYGFQILM